MAQLILIQDGAERARFEMSDPVITIGRSPTNSVIIPDRFVSRQHAQVLLCEDGAFEIQDLGGTQPLKVNGRVIERKPLKNGDRITMGQSTLLYKADADCDTDHLMALVTEDITADGIEVESISAKTSAFSLADTDVKDLSSLQKDHQRLMLLYEFGKCINSYLEDRQHLLVEIMNAAFKILDAERGFIALADSNNGDLIYEYIRDDTSEKQPDELQVSKTIVHKVFKEGVSLLTYNALEDVDFEEAQSVKQYNIRSAICAPLLFRDTVLGVVYLDNRASEGIFCKDDLMFLMGMCHQAGIALGNSALHKEVVKKSQRLEKALKPQYQIVGDSEAMKKVYKAMQKVSPTDVTVLIQGETGTGKELVARAIHSLSPRSEYPFVEVNCAAIPKDLIESELFGHEKGAFTGALKFRQGKFQSAHRGTIFLDEIGDMSVDTQAKVLRVLEQKEVQRVGSSESTRVDVRVIAATNKDLSQAVAAGTFREDLFYRLNVFTLKLPPLRERKEDILPLAEYFMAKRAKKISDKAQKLLLSHTWPGNIRELRNYIDRAIVLGDGQVIQPEDLPFSLRTGDKVIPSPIGSLASLEESHIRRILRSVNWRKIEAAKVLGITRQTLDNKIAKYKIRK
jgi:Nif-specific regulatory protein